MKRKIAAAAVAGVLALGAGAACTTEDSSPVGRADTEQLEEDIEKELQKQHEKAEEDIGPEQAVGDLKVKKVVIGDAYGIGGESLPYADVAVTNTTDKPKQYEYEIEVMKASNGDRIDTLYGAVDHVRPGQTVDTGDGDGQEDPMSSLVENVQKVPVEYEVLHVDRY